MLADRASAIDALAARSWASTQNNSRLAWEAAPARRSVRDRGRVPILPFVVARGSVAVASSVVISRWGFSRLRGDNAVYGAPVWRSGAAAPAGPRGGRTDVRLGKLIACDQQLTYSLTSSAQSGREPVVLIKEAYANAT